MSQKFVKNLSAKAAGLMVAFSLCLTLLAPGGVWAQPSSDSGVRAANPQITPESVPWRYSVKPYLFLSGVSGSITSDNVTFPINSSFSELVENLRFGGFVSLAATKGQWGFWADLEYISLKGSGSGRVPVDLILDTLIGELDATYSPSPGSSLRFVGGVRLFDVSQSLVVSDDPAAEVSTTVVDPIVGAVGTWDLGENWVYQMRGDIGGFGVGSEFTYQLMLEFQWQISESVGLPFGYRVLSYQIRQDSLWLDTRLSGLFAGLDFRF